MSYLELSDQITPERYVQIDDVMICTACGRALYLDASSAEAVARGHEAVHRGLAEKGAHFKQTERELLQIMAAKLALAGEHSAALFILANLKTISRGIARI